MSERQFAVFIFAGGTCDICGGFAANLPCIMSLRFLLCSRSCAKQLQINSAFVPLACNEKLPQKDAKHLKAKLFETLPRYRVMGLHVYRPPSVQKGEQEYIDARGQGTLKALLKEWAVKRVQNDQFMRASKALHQWSQDRGQTAVSITRKETLCLFADIAKEEGTTLPALSRSRIFRRHIDAFVRDRTVATPIVWSTIRGRVLDEIRKGSIVRDVTRDISRNEKHFRCGYCPSAGRMFTPSGFVDHLKYRHSIIVSPALVRPST
ncbi:hypothetical protein ONZ45_g11790 [Pleurotus djamor]|nr:hypothetical protein ONZ45_g11790 [Pleurotus djamor]